MKILFYIVISLVLINSTEAKVKWFRHYIEPGFHYTSVYSYDSTVTWIGTSKGYLFRTNDAGKSWKRILVLNRLNIKELYFSSAKSGWLIGNINSQPGDIP